MAFFVGREWTKRSLVARIGDPAQLAGARPSVLFNGKSEGVKAVDIYSGGGLHFTVLPGRGMDIPFALYKGTNLHYFSSAGITSPAYYEPQGQAWLRSFFVGLLTTCGITQSGGPGVDGGEPLGMHGRVANAAAEDVNIRQEWEGDEYVVEVSGKIREANFRGENMLLKRSYRTALGWKKFILTDIIENRGFDPQPLMMLYHINFGFPLLGPNARVVGPIVGTKLQNAGTGAPEETADALVFPEPTPDLQRNVYHHTLAGEERTFVSLVNRDLGDGTPLGVVLRFDLRELPCLAEWKHVREGFYVVGLEPGVVHPAGRTVLREKGELPMLDGQAQYRISIDFEIIDSHEAMDDLEREAAELVGS
jgi:hypothetical protein